MIYAQILNGIIKNTIVLEDDSLSALFSNGFDYFLRIDNLTPQPALGWTYDGTVFSPPVVSALPIQQIVQKKIESSIAQFNNLMIQFVVSNVLQGITQAGKTQLISDALADVQRYGQSGSLYAVIAELQSIQLTSDMAPFLTADVISSLISQAQVILANL